MFAEKMCHRCGKKGHMVKNCPMPSNDPLWNTCVRCGRKGHFVKDCTKPPSYSMPCNNCGQIGHWSNECPSKKIDKNQPCFNCGKPGHWSKECPEAIKPNESGKQKCFSCGKFGHVAKECADVRKFGDGAMTVVRVADVVNGSLSATERQAKLNNLQTQIAELLSQKNANAGAKSASAAQLAQLSALQEQMNALHEQITGKPLLLAPKVAVTPRASAGDALPHFLDRPLRTERHTGVVVQVVPKRKYAEENSKNKKEEEGEKKKVKVEVLSSLVDYGDEEDEEDEKNTILNKTEIDNINPDNSAPISNTPT